MLSWINRILLYFIGMLGLVCLLLWIFGYSYIFRGVRLSYFKGYTSANIYDGNDFSTREIANTSAVQFLPKSAFYNKIELPNNIVNMLEATSSTSFLVLHQDSIFWEKYFLKHTEKSRSNSFSMAKSVITTLVQIAIEEGKIKSWDEKVIHFIPELRGKYATDVTLKHLSTMTAGLDWDESYKNPFSITAEAYYGTDIRKTMQKVSVSNKPGENYLYQSGATQLLGFCLEAAVKKKVAVYMSEKIWQPIGAEYAASWHLDQDNGSELMYCCINATTLDFAKLGKIFLHHGTIGNHHFFDSSFLINAVKPHFADYYSQSFWIKEIDGHKAFWMQGTLGQYIIMIPDLKLVIVRTGNHNAKNINHLHEDVSTYLIELIKYFSTKPK